MPLPPGLCEYMARAVQTAECLLDPHLATLMDMLLQLPAEAPATAHYCWMAAAAGCQSIRLRHALDVAIGAGITLRQGLAPPLVVGDDEEEAPMELVGINPLQVRRLRPQRLETRVWRLLDQDVALEHPYWEAPARSAAGFRVPYNGLMACCRGSGPAELPQQALVLSLEGPHSFVVVRSLHALEPTPRTEWQLLSEGAHGRWRALRPPRWCAVGVERWNPRAETAARGALQALLRRTFSFQRDRESASSSSSPVVQPRTFDLSMSGDSMPPDGLLLAPLVEAFHFELHPHEQLLRCVWGRDQGAAKFYTAPRAGDVSGSQRLWVVFGLRHVFRLQWAEPGRLLYQCSGLPEPWRLWNIALNADQLRTVDEASADCVLEQFRGAIGAAAGPFDTIPFYDNGRLYRPGGGDGGGAKTHADHMDVQ